MAVNSGIPVRGTSPLSRRPSKSQDDHLGKAGQSVVARRRLFLLSASDESSLDIFIGRLQSFLQDRGDDASDEWVGNLAFTLNKQHEQHTYRAMVVAQSIGTLKTALSSRPQIRKASTKPTIGFIFTGQGAHWTGMGKELLDTYPVFRQSMQKMNDYIGQLGAPYDVIEILNLDDHSTLGHVLLSQTLCTALQIALVDLLASWGIYPDGVAGHSSGEIAAAYAAGMLSMQDAIAIAYFRGVCASSLSTKGRRGSMMAVGMSVRDIDPYLAALRTGRANVACINSPSSITVSGDYAAIEELGTVLQDKEVFTRRLNVDVAYHSHHMDPIAGEYLKLMTEMKTIKPSKQPTGSTQFFSSVTGTEISTTELGPHYWVQNLVQQVKLVDAVQSLCFETNPSGIPNEHSSEQTRLSTFKKVAVTNLIEIGPHAALAGPIKQILKADPRLDKANVAYDGVLIRGLDATSTAMAVAASLAANGYPVNLQAINDPETLYRPQVLVDLPLCS
ncbi:acyltransferase domain-containing protein [Aspergillus puulaauensis]|uniref:Malonyl-CoA:ACP transacylase (MAT) domain-containing protein n=1 Tax=Aspergillus puulaauensis TaxID=1220207 RepID=A0A7R8AST1_9EURO|nr:uncharacterized protein APUU_61168S [Aspergillus puulaauensis]BCS28120.1 hypothetical protein APUU_61168S [Aspergillus puulaauensis]